jgi:hypothetical protein
MLGGISLQLGRVVSRFLSMLVRSGHSALST